MKDFASTNQTTDNVNRAHQRTAETNKNRVCEFKIGALHLGDFKRTLVLIQTLNLSPENIELSKI